MKLSRIAIFLLLLILLAVTAYFFLPSARTMALVAAGRSPVCPLSRALETEAHEAQLMAVKDRILAASKLVRRDEEHGIELWNTPKGDFWIPMRNQYVLPFNLAEMELQVYGSGKHFVQPGDVVLDCGASDGDFTREALKAGAKLVVAIEVSPTSIECIRRNLAGEVAAGKVIVYGKGVWDKEDQLTLNVVPTNFAANSVVIKAEGAKSTTTVPLTTIDHIVGELGLERVDFIKMDIEGAEARAIAGAAETLKRFKPRLSITAEHSLEDEVVIPEAVKRIRTDYRMECGPCLESEGRFRADILYFN